MECAPKVRFATDSRWRKQNSNHRSPSRGCRLILGEEKGPAVDQIVSKDAVLFTGDQWFESGSLQRAVCLSGELWTLWAKGAATAAGVVEAKPVGKHFGGMLAEQRCRFDGSRDAVKAHRPGGHRHRALAMRHRLQDAALPEAGF